MDLDEINEAYLGGWCLIHTSYVEYGFGLFPLQQCILLLEVSNHVSPVLVLAHELHHDQYFLHVMNVIVVPMRPVFVLVHFLHCLQSQSFSSQWI